MITKLTGHLDSIADDHLVIDVQGIGYLVHASAKTLTQLPELGQKFSLWIEHIIRQDYQQLCGFYDPQERQCFRLLLTVQGVGVRVALAILSALGVEGLSNAIAQQDRLILTQSEGVGAKIAGRIVLELKDKMFSATVNLSVNTPASSSSVQDALAGLLGLGYSKSEASFALTKTLQESPPNTSAETLIRLALQKLVK
jgi:Holliday junction DNA helicase RuvA